MIYVSNLGIFFDCLWLCYSDTILNFHSNAIVNALDLTQMPMTENMETNCLIMAAKFFMTPLTI